jgi:uncharacterized protein YjaZ
MDEYNLVKSRYAADWNLAESGSWGLMKTATGKVFIAKGVPCDKVRSVMVHEYTHVLQWRLYGSSLVSDLESHGGAEEIADCGARMLGATWTHYVQTCTAEQTRSADAILRGVRP